MKKGKSKWTKRERICRSSRSRKGSGLRFALAAVVKSKGRHAATYAQLQKIARRAFLRNTLIGAAAAAEVVAMPHVIAKPAPPALATLWITDSEPVVALSVRLLARQCGITNTRIFCNKPLAIEQLSVAVLKPAFIVTDYGDREMRGDEFVRLARQIAPRTKMILFSAIVCNLDLWIRFAGAESPRPDEIVEKPDTKQLMGALCQSKQPSRIKPNGA